MSHASNIIAQLRLAEEDENIPEEVRENAKERRKELEDEGDGETDE